MALRFFGKDPNTGQDECPSIWLDDEEWELIFQGWKAGEGLEARCRETGSIPDTEAVIRIPIRMIPIIRKACDAADRARPGLR